MKRKILLIEDDAGTRFGFVRYFSREGYDVCEAETLVSGADIFNRQYFDAVVIDINLPDGNGIEFITKVRSGDACIPIIVITGAGDIPLAVDAMHRGADNFLTKPVDNGGLAVFLRKTIELADLKRRHSARQRLEVRDEIFLGDSPVMQEVLELARIAASSNSPVLITGGTGTGKGMLGRWIHQQSSRSGFDFVELNCSGLRGELLSREIFGNARGAYTSADQDRKGLLDIADKGTLFLDEIGDMNMEIQSQFLKVLEEKSYRRLGDVKLLRSDFRLVCATNMDIQALVAKGQFRQDLLYRINLIAIHMPSLRDRKKELPALVNHLLWSLKSSERTVSAEVMQMLKTYQWPGNIRELKNVLERALLLSRGDVLLPKHFSGLGNVLQKPDAPSGKTAREIEEQHINNIMGQVGGDIDAAAEVLNISRATLYRRLKVMKSKQ